MILHNIIATHFNKGEGAAPLLMNNSLALNIEREGIPTSSPNQYVPRGPRGD